jgi:hypothetical protein
MVPGAVSELRWMEAVEDISIEGNVLFRARPAERGGGCRMSYDFCRAAGFNSSGSDGVPQNLTAKSRR